MLDRRNSSGHKPVPDPGAEPGRPRPHPLLKTGIVIAILLLLLGLLSLYLPTYIASHLVTSEFDKLGIEYEGVDMLEINPCPGVVVRSRSLRGRPVGRRAGGGTGSHHTLQSAAGPPGLYRDFDVARRQYPRDPWRRPGIFSQRNPACRDFTETLRSDY